MIHGKLFRARLALFIVAAAVLGLNSTTSAKSFLKTPTVNWHASTLPDASRINLNKILTTNSTGSTKFSTQGPCTVKGLFLITTKVGSCRIQLRLGANSNFAAIKSSVIVQVKKKTELNVLATASLANAFNALGDAYSARFLNVSVKFSFAGSATLATQIQQGAPVDIVAMADAVNMNKVLLSGDIDQKSVSLLARNRLAILVQRGNPQKINLLIDLTRAGLKVVLCDISQPCGSYAATLLNRANITFTVASREASASGVVSRIASGEADAGIAYITDGLVSGDKVDAVKISDNVNVTADYLIGIARKPNSKDSLAISSFIAMAKSVAGREIFSDLGFGLP